MKKTPFVLISLSLLAISCADKSGSTTSSADAAILSGFVSDGEAVAARTVEAYNADGALVAQAITDETGAYQIEVAAAELPLLLEVKLASAALPVFAKTVATVVESDEVGSEVLRAVVAEEAQDCVDAACVVHVNPVSELVAQKVLEQAELGELTRENVRIQGDSLVKQLFGVDMGAEAFLTDPSFRPGLVAGDSALRLSGAVAEPNSAGLLLQALKGQAQQQGTSALEALKACSGLMQDTAFVGLLFHYTLQQGADTTALQAQVREWYGEDVEAIETMEQMWEEVRSEEAAEGSSSSGESEGEAVVPQGTGEIPVEPTGEGSVNEPTAEGSVTEPVGDGSDPVGGTLQEPAEEGAGAVVVPVGDGK